MSVGGKSVPTWGQSANLVIYWTLVSALGGMVLYPVFFLLASAGLSGLTTSVSSAGVWIGAPLAGFLAGALVGLGQWLVLRQRQSGAYAWTLISGLSWSAGLIAAVGLFFWLLPEGFSYVTLLAPFIVAGTLAGLIQSALVRGWVSNVHWWVLASTSGWTLGWVVGLVVVATAIRRTGLPPEVLLVGLGGFHGALIGFQSGGAYMILTLFQPRSTGWLEAGLEPPASP